MYKCTVPGVAIFSAVSIARANKGLTWLWLCLISFMSFPTVATIMDMRFGFTLTRRDAQTFLPDAFDLRNPCKELLTLSLIVVSYISSSVFVAPHPPIKKNNSNQTRKGCGFAYTKLLLKAFLISKSHFSSAGETG